MVMERGQWDDKEQGESIVSQADTDEGYPEDDGSEDITGGSTRRLGGGGRDATDDDDSGIGLGSNASRIDHTGGGTGGAAGNSGSGIASRRNPESGEGGSGYGINVG